MQSATLFNGVPPPVREAPVRDGNGTAHVDYTPTSTGLLDCRQQEGESPSKYLLLPCFALCTCPNRTDVQTARPFMHRPPYGLRRFEPTRPSLPCCPTPFYVVITAIVGPPHHPCYRFLVDDVQTLQPPSLFLMHLFYHSNCISS